MIDVSKLNHWRRSDLEAIIFMGHPGLPGNIAGDIVLGSKSHRRSIRFSIEQHDDVPPYVILSAEDNTRCTDGDVRRFFRFSELVAVREHPPQARPWCRRFELKETGK